MLPILIMMLLSVLTIVILVVKKNSFAKLATVAGLGISFVLSCYMLIETMNNEVIVYTLGSAPWNLSLRVGVLESLMSVLFTGIGGLIMWASCSMIEHDVIEERISYYYALITALIATLCAVVFFDNLINVFIFIELSSFAAAGIVLIKNQPENLRAGLKYLSLSIFGSSMVLMGIVIFYSVTGQLVMGDIHTSLLTTFAGNENAIFFALCFITLGVFFKSALFPFHIWLPDAHGTAPSPSSAVLSSLVLKAYIIFFIKVLFVVLGTTILQSGNFKMLLNVILVLGSVAMIAGSCMAILQKDIKRMIAYSSVAQIGYIFMGIGLGTKLGIYAAIFHIVAHAVTKSALFLEAGSIIEQTHNRDLEKMTGLGKQMPITMALFTIGALSMVGIPLFIGFNSKWNFATAIINAKVYWVVLVLALSSLLNAAYYLPVVIRAFFTKTDEPKEYCERRFVDLLPMIILATLVIGLAVFSGPITNAINQAIAVLF